MPGGTLQPITLRQLVNFPRLLNQTFAPFPFLFRLRTKWGEIKTPLNLKISNPFLLSPLPDPLSLLLWFMWRETEPITTNAVRPPLSPPPPSRCTTITTGARPPLLVHLLTASTDPRPLTPRSTNCLTFRCAAGSTNKDGG